MTARAAQWLMPGLPTLPVLLLVLLTSACSGYPRDPGRTSERVRGGVMRVGIAHDPPFLQVDGDGAPAGREAALLLAFARSQGARIAWRRQGHVVLMRELRERRLDVVVGGHAPDSPWAVHVATSRPYRVADASGRLVERVVALPPGENAWLLAFDRHAHAPASRALLEGNAR